MKIIKYLVLTVSIIIILIIGSLFSLAKYYNNEIKNIALKEINQQLNQPIAADKISLNAFSQFPFISLEFTNFKIQNPISIKDTLIFSEKGFLNFDIYDLWDKNYKVRKLILNTGFLNISIDKKGNNNYTIFKESTDTLTNEFNFGLDQVVFENFNIIYSNVLLKQDYNFLIETSKFKGAFSENE
jgi:AsmA protein